MKLIRLRKEDINEFNGLMQESFQIGYESVYGENKELVLPIEDIMKSLNNPKCHSYEMLNDKNEIIGGAIVEINDSNINHLDFLFVKVGVQSKGIGQSIWKQIEDLYPNTKIYMHVMFLPTVVTPSCLLMNTYFQNIKHLGPEM